MPVITFVEYNGNEHDVQAQCGESLMNAAIMNGVPGIDADCGGACACGTCHVMLDAPWLAKVGTPDVYEEPLLDLNPARETGSRLSCQINVTPELDGMRVRLPEYQY